MIAPPLLRPNLLGLRGEFIHRLSACNAWSTRPTRATGPRAIDEAIKRCNMGLDAGADMTLIMDINHPRPAADQRRGTGYAIGGPSTSHPYFTARAVTLSMSYSIAGATMPS